MNYLDIEKRFQDKEFDYHKFVPLALEDKSVRDKLIENIVDGKNHINIYYRSYYIVDEASKEKPELFYEYWDNLVTILHHKNTYHRLIAHWLLTNLISVDKDNKFAEIKDEFFAAIDDEKVLVGLEAVKDITIVSEYRSDLEEEIISLFLNDNMLKNYLERQKERFYFLYMEYFDTVLEKRKDQRLIDFCRKCLTVKNTNTLKQTKKVLKKYDN